MCSRAEISICRELSMSKSQRCSLLGCSAQQCYGGRKHYFANTIFTGFRLCLFHGVLRTQGLQEGLPNNTVSLPRISLSWSLINTVFLIGRGKNVAQILYGKIVQVIIFYRNHRELFLCTCAPSTGCSAFTERSQRKFCHEFQWEHKRCKRARFLIGIMLMDSEKQLS